MNEVIEVHRLTKDPTAAWEVIRKKGNQQVLKVEMIQPTAHIPYDKVRIVCMSDTHNLTHRIQFDIPDGDIFIHTGDFTNCGEINGVKEFNNWIGHLPHRYKVVIAGNHELSFDRNKLVGGNKEEENVREYLTNCIYLEDANIELFGLKIYSSPWQPEFGNWAFNVPRGEQLLAKWNQIPEGVDILITHGPPIGHGDLCRSGLRAGCVELLTTVQKRVKPKYHIFGHIHEGYGITTDGNITFVNASTCNFSYLPINPPIVFDLDLPSGICKN